MTHTTLITTTPEGYLGQCETCDDRGEFGGYGDAQAWCDKHERRGQYLLLNRGSQPTLKTLHRYYTQCATDLRYTPEERAQWQMLADETWQHVRDKADVTVGQMPLFDDGTE